MENTGVHDQDPCPGIIVIKAPEANWYTVHADPEAEARYDTELEVRIKELSKAHIAAQDDYMNWRYPEPLHPISRLRRIGNMIGRVFTR